MEPSARRRFMIVVITAGTIGLLLIGVGIYGLIRGPGTSADPSDPSETSAPRSTDPGRGSDALPMVRGSADPVDYAREIAQALFTWDTSSGIDRSDYLQVLADEAAPAGEEGNGLVADLGNYFPTQEQWRQLLGYETRQQLTIDSAEVPGSWAQILEDASGQLAEGTVAVTIRGERQRSGVWNGEDASSSHEVAFTVFVLCPPEADRCHLLRLSGLGTPLE
ncbi:hypothetical protein J2X12_003829 [Pseudarthrobacter oxydans]|uniref:Uncharacterized protein n=1 Tax=Pseudarthrobacter oxydans TaxID=1671 RepID=A0AAW8NHE0_PSEOX|nr:hypothetical protein [Pseudarthrobacter oxydans]MBU3995065.1 hypothetical protein [Actinomycetota bacterium]MDR7165775.1 hypothetical protein [Pseudarthrobacter oxydans]